MKSNIQDHALLPMPNLQFALSVSFESVRPHVFGRFIRERCRWRLHAYCSITTPMLPTGNR